MFRAKRPPLGFRQRAERRRALNRRPSSHTERVGYHSEDCVASPEYYSRLKYGGDVKIRST